MRGGGTGTRLEINSKLLNGDFQVFLIGTRNKKKSI